MKRFLFIAYATALLAFPAFTQQAMGGVITLSGRSVRGITFDSGVLWVIHTQIGGNGNVVKISKVDPGTGQTLLGSVDI